MLTDVLLIGSIGLTAVVIPLMLRELKSDDEINAATPNHKVMTPREFRKPLICLSVMFVPMLLVAIDQLGAWLGSLVVVATYFGLGGVLWKEWRRTRG